MRNYPPRGPGTLHGVTKLEQMEAEIVRLKGREADSCQIILDLLSPNDGVRIEGRKAAFVWLCPDKPSDDGMGGAGDG